jgi:hypothetical protein
MAGKKRTSGVFVSWPKPHFPNTVKTNKHFSACYRGALMYAHYELTALELRKETMKYLKKIESPLFDRAKDIHENRFAIIGKYMYILNNNADIPDDVMNGLLPATEKMICEEEAKIAAEKKQQEYLQSKEKGDSIVVDTNKVVITIQDRLREKAHEVAGEVEGWLDDFVMDRKSNPKTVQDFVNLFKTYELKSAHMPHMRFIFERRIAEYERVVECKDKDLNEAYSNFSKVDMKKLLSILTNLYSACDMVQEVAKVVRAPRKKKPVSTEKIVSKLKYKKEDSTLGIVSLNPTQILGAKEVWSFNTKTRKISRFVADDVQGPLSVKGASLIGYNEAKSVSKNLRKPVEQLAEFKKAGKVQLRTFMDGIKAVEIKANGRMNEDIVILKILA